MSDFATLNIEITKAQTDLELSIQKRIKAEELLDFAKIELVKAESAKKRAALEQKLAQESLSALKERSYNARQEARI